MPTKHPAFGIGLAAFGALVLSPDALFMRLSGMEGLQMVAWRGSLMGLLFLGAWALTRRGAPQARAGDLAALASGAGLAVLGAQVASVLLFPTGIALAPVAIMLIGVATSPVWAALLSRYFFGEKTGRATWITMAVVLVGIAIAVSGHGDVAISPRALLGALCGVGVAFMLALNFTILRFVSEIPILLVMGLGSGLAGLLALVVSGPAGLTEGHVPSILVTALLILPISFFALFLAPRHTAAANVSLLMLLETVLGPLWVWVGIGEAPTPRMLAGGALVIGALAIYLARPKRRARM